MNRRSPSKPERIAFGIILAAVVCLCAALLVPGFRRLHERHNRINDLTNDVKADEGKKHEREREIAELDTDEGVERAAREDLHYAKEGETVFDFEPAAPPSAAAQAPDGTRTPAPSGGGRP